MRSVIARSLRSFLTVAVVCAISLGALPLYSASYLHDQAFAEEPTAEDGGDEGGQGEPGGDSGGFGESGDGSGDESGGDSGDSGGGSGGSGGTVQHYVDDVAIFYHQTSTCLGYATNPYLETAYVSTKGGTIQFDSVVYWSDWTNEPGTRLVTWSTSDPSLATINSAGILTAIADGKVEVRATVSSNTVSGSSLVAKAYVDISGQSDARYVTSVRIADPDGNDIGSAAYVLEADITTAQAQFHALVDVMDPVTGQTQTYSTKNGSISSQTGDIADVLWYAGDSAMAAVDETQGLFRPLVYGIVTLYVSSNAGFGNATVTGSATVNTKDPEGGMVKDGYHPQAFLTVKAYYELYQPTNMQGDDERFVINKTYSVEEMESMGTITQSYTALGGGSYYTMTGRGVPLSTVLANAGVNVAGVKQLAFGTADHIDRPVSYGYIFGENRYYYPNVDIGSYTGAQQVYPILALESNEVKNASADPNYDMSEGTRFRLLFGSTPAGGTSQYQIKWIHTLYVVLEGGPAVTPGDGEGGGGGSSGGGDGSEGAVGDGSGAGESGIGAGAGLAEGTQGGADAASLGDTEAAEGESGGSAGDASGTESSGGHTASGKFSVFQVMNRNDSETERAIDPDNPFKRYAFPLGVAVLAVGGMESFVWYRRQVRGVALA